MSKIIAKEIIAKDNKRALLMMQAQQDDQSKKDRAARDYSGGGVCPATRSLRDHDLVKDVDLSWVWTSNRFRDMKRNKIELTLSKKTDVEK